MSLKGDRLTTKELQRDAPNEGKIVKSDHPGSKKKEMASKMAKRSEKEGNHAYPGLVEHNNAAAMAIDKHNNSWNGKEYTHKQKGCGIKGCKYD